MMKINPGGGDGGVVVVVGGGVKVLLSMSVWVQLIYAYHEKQECVSEHLLSAFW